MSTKPTAAQMAALKAAAPAGLRVGGAGAYPIGVEGAKPNGYGTLAACMRREWLRCDRSGMTGAKWFITDAGRAILATVPA